MSLPASEALGDTLPYGGTVCRGQQRKGVGRIEASEESGVVTVAEEVGLIRQQKSGLEIRILSGILPKHVRMRRLVYIPRARKLHARAAWGLFGVAVSGSNSRPVVANSRELDGTAAPTREKRFHGGASIPSLPEFRRSFVAVR